MRFPRLTIGFLLAFVMVSAVVVGGVMIQRARACRSLAAKHATLAANCLVAQETYEQLAVGAEHSLKESRKVFDTAPADMGFLARAGVALGRVSLNKIVGEIRKDRERAESYRARRAYHLCLADNYRRAARSPWLSLPSDSPPPK